VGFHEQVGQTVPRDMIARRSTSLKVPFTERSPAGRHLAAQAGPPPMMVRVGSSAPFGVVVLGEGSRVKVENTERLRSEVLDVAQRIREHRRTIRDEIPVKQPAAKCRVCGQRGNCGQAL
jgi:hypothetical protein